MPDARCAAFAAGLALVLASAVAAEPTLAQRTEAARRAANDDAACRAVRPFYWSVGDATGVRAEDRVGTFAPTGTTRMPIASASKWVYGAYVVQKRGGALTAQDIPFLNFTSGYTEFTSCRREQTVASCDAWRTNGTHDAGNDGRFYYDGGHMEKHAAMDGLGPDGDDALALAINAMLGTDFRYTQPQLAGGISTTPSDYGDFLQRIVRGELLMHDALGTHAVCTNPVTCPTAVHTPMVPGQSPHYSIGHWVEDDPEDGDGAFSSAGAFGFYPWIDRSKTWWGVLARVDFAVGRQPGPGVQSVACGARIRAAWVSGGPL